MPYFESPVDGTRLHYVDHGPADGPVAVFVASAYLGHEMWEYQMLPLAEAGHPASPWTGGATAGPTTPGPATTSTPSPTT
ncbi:alpha/beta fold hydrolase [Streptomyces sp. 900105245]